MKVKTEEQEIRKIVLTVSTQFCPICSPSTYGNQTMPIITGVHECVTCGSRWNNNLR